jgi:hypothetical protein
LSHLHSITDLHRHLRSKIVWSIHVFNSSITFWFILNFSMSIPQLLIENRISSHVISLHFIQAHWNSFTLIHSHSFISIQFTLIQSLWTRSWNVNEMKCPEMIWNDLKWSEMIWNDLKWEEM